MAASAEILIQPPPEVPQVQPDNGSDRRADIDGKQVQVAGLLQEFGCDGLLLFEPANIAWLTSGAAARGSFDPPQLPALYLSADQRWVLASNADSQRLFDEELDGMGLQLKEWPWHWGRSQLLADLCQGRNLLSDRPFGSCKLVGERLGRLRRALTPYEQACYRAVGDIVSHALEATCRTVSLDDTEREIAGQLSHRLMHRGAQVIGIEVAVDGRSRIYRQCGYTATPLTKYCVLLTTARKYGLCVTASRTVCFGEPDAQLQAEHDAACKVNATYISVTWPDALPGQILAAGRRIYELTGFEHEWKLAPQGFVTGRAIVELGLLPGMEEVFQAGWAITWRSSAGAAVCCDSVLVSDTGPRNMTPVEMWPAKRIRAQGTDYFRPDILFR